MELYSIIVATLATTVAISAAVLLPALGEGISERAGILNIGIEGYMIIGALASYLAYTTSGNIWVALLSGIFAGVMLSLLHAFLCITLRFNQIISGTGIWLLGVGLSAYIFRLVGEVADVEKFEVTPILFLKDIPFLGQVFFQHNIIVYISFLLVPIFAIILHRTPWGLVTKAAGDSPLSTDMAGHNVFLIRYISTMVCGAMGGLGGAYLVLATLGRFSEGMTAGRGFIAICIAIFGGWDPKKILGGALFFSLIDAGQMYMQATMPIIPFPLLILAPYLLTLIALVAISKRAREIPRKLATIYKRGEE